LREFEVKLSRLRQWLAAGGFDAVEIVRYSWLAWLLEGAEARVLASPERGNCSVVVTADRTVLIANNIEAPRLQAEEIGDLPLEWVVYNWWEAPPVVIPAGCKLAGDIPVRLRLTLLPEEAARARKLGRDAADALEAAGRTLQPGLSEHQIAARIAERAWERGVVPTGLFVAADERGKQFRHPIPTSKPAHRNAVLSLVGRRHGLNVSVTRSISFGPACDEMLRRHRAVSDVHRAMLAASRPGVSLGSIFEAARSSYAQAGFPEEWTFHHQGGPAGYESREGRATPQNGQILEAGQMVAWNPTIRGSKSEETALITESGAELLTAAANWPVLAATTPSKTFPLADLLVL
jgi:antitoxin VapB